MVAFTLRVKAGAADFYQAAVVDACIGILEAICTGNSLQAIYCFMPDHLHIVLIGQSPNCDLWKSLVEFKQRTGFWFKCNRPQIKWQKDFYDHIVRNDEGLRHAITYCLGNPLAKEVVDDWQEYPYKGGIGLDLETIF